MQIQKYSGWYRQPEDGILTTTVNADQFWNARPATGLIAIAWELFYDFHCLMNNKIIYPHHPKMTLPEVFPNLKEEKLGKIDDLARLILQKPDENFEKLKYVWETNKQFRLLKDLLLYSS